MTLLWDNGIVQLRHGDCRDVLAQMSAESVHCVVTSPPYFGLRNYGLEPTIWGDEAEHKHEWGQPLPKAGKVSPGQGGSTLTGGHESWGNRDGASQGQFCACGAWLGTLGLEPTPELYVEHLVEIFRQARRVLRDDGTLWLNMGDSYSSGGRGYYDDATGRNLGSHINRYRAPPPHGLKPKDLRMMPARVALALQADGAASPETMRVVSQIAESLLSDFGTWDAVPERTRAVLEGLDREWADAQKGGWWLRSDIIWSKPNPMPESVTERPTTAHEHVFLLTKAATYHYDAEAIREPGEGWQWASASKFNAEGQAKRGGAVGHTNGQGFHSAEIRTGRNRRTVWEIATEPYPDAHFATFPQALVEPCVLAGCPEGGTVCDPFAGSGTVGVVAQKLGRRAVLIDASADYLALARARVEAIPLPMKMGAR